MSHVDLLMHGAVVPAGWDVIGAIERHPSAPEGAFGLAVIRNRQTGIDSAWDGQAIRSLPRNYREQVEFTAEERAVLSAESIREAVAEGLPEDRRKQLRMEVLNHGARDYSINLWLADWPAATGMLPADLVSLRAERLLSDYVVRPELVAEARAAIAATDERHRG